MNKKPRVSETKKFLALGLLVVSAPLWVPLVILFILYMMYKMFTVWQPVILKMQMEPLYWLTWHEVKRLSGKSTFDVLDCLQSCTRAGVLECRYRDNEIVTKLRRRRSINNTVLPPSGPLLPENAIFYEFRVRAKSGKRRPKFLDLFKLKLPQFGPVLQPVPIR